MNSLPRKKRATFDRSYPWAYYFQDWEPVVLKENNRTAEKNERRLKIHATLRIDSCNNLYCVLSPSLSFSLSFRHFLYLSSTNIHAHSNIRRTLFPFSPWILSLSIFLYAPTIFKCNVPRLWDRTFLVGYCPLLRLPFDRVNAFTPFIYRVYRGVIYEAMHVHFVHVNVHHHKVASEFFFSFFSFFPLWLFLLFCKLNFFFFFYLCSASSSSSSLPSSSIFFLHF